MSRRPLGLRRLSRDEMAWLNVLCARMGSLRFDWMGRRATCAWRPDAPACQGLHEIVLDWSGARLLLRVDDTWLAEAAGHAVGATLHAGVPDVVRAAVVESALSDRLAAIEKATRKRLRVVGVGAPGATAGLHRLPWRLDAGGPAASHGELWADALALGFLASALRQAARPDGGASAALFADLPIRVRLVAGWSDLTRGQVAALKPRDVVLLDDAARVLSGEILLRAGDRLAWRCALRDTSIDVLEGGTNIMSDPEDDIDLAEDEPLEGESLDELPVRLSFDLGDRTITYAQLCELAPGYTFDLGRDLRRAVVVRANGRRIGEGELVDIDGRVGVALLSVRGHTA